MTDIGKTAQNQVSHEAARATCTRKGSRKTHPARRNDSDIDSRATAQNRDNQAASSSARATCSGILAIKRR
jgi:hypothetical protein